jgi:hypothetical protein
MRTAIERAFRLDAVADDLASAMPARGRERVNGAFEAVVRVRFAREHDLKGFVVVVPADFAFRHRCSPAP